VVKDVQFKCPCSILSGSTSSATDADQLEELDNLETLQYPQRIDFLSNTRGTTWSETSVSILQYPQRIDFLSNFGAMQLALAPVRSCSILSGSTSSATHQRAVGRTFDGSLAVSSADRLPQQQKR